MRCFSFSLCLIFYFLFFKIMTLDETTGYTICRIARKIHYRVDDLFKPYGLTVEQWVALKSIEEHAPLYQKELALVIEKNQNTVKSLVSHLEAKGFITRTVDPKDKRNLMLSVTEKGRALIRPLSVIDEKANTDFFSHFSPEEMKALETLLAKVEEKL